VGRRCLVECGGPAGEELERVLGWGVRFGGVGEDGQSGVGRAFHGLEGQVQVADDWVAGRCSQAAPDWRSGVRERVADPVGGEEHAAVAYPGRCTGDGVEDPLHSRPDPLR
jgi:hypothetical protein